MLTSPVTRIHDHIYSTFQAFEFPDQIYLAMERDPLKAVKNHASYLKRERVGSFPVEAVNSCYLFKVDTSILAKLFQIGPANMDQDDDKAISGQLRNASVSMHLYNAEIFGYLNDKGMYRTVGLTETSLRKRLKS